MRRKRKQQKRLLEERLRDLQRLEAMEAAVQAEGEGQRGHWTTKHAYGLQASTQVPFCPFSTDSSSRLEQGSGSTSSSGCHPEGTRAGPSPASSSPVPGGERSLSPSSQTSGFSGSLFSTASCSILSGSSNQRETGGLLSPSSKCGAQWVVDRQEQQEQGQISLSSSSFLSTIWCFQPPGKPPGAPKCRQDQDQDCRPWQRMLGGMLKT